MDDSTGTVFRDVIMVALLGFVAVLLLVLAHLNPPGRKANADITPPGNVLVEIVWDAEFNTDVDLWVQAPGDVPVGYSNKGGRFFNLLRDDLGHTNDITPLNYEVSYTRGIPAGEYTVNVHMFRPGDAVLPLSVAVIVSVKANVNAKLTQIVTATVELLEKGQEITAMRFNLDGNGRMVPGSAHALYKPLRTAR